ncbi:uncharacterized protein BP5553_06068 [Venustampulla echinocandica]|uniref:Uncharacterized protein n=1 Tax=Venustampulla echinocandica TaxID=2656787 RepID=A0A370TMG0_9HELO|nr:uncharacterized protein BP5553_06068 [Venustampulla echinocandica]RDL36716.1 hypothetical protein BP5553_06068 [Venustampulla echinocandica]
MSARHRIPKAGGLCDAPADYIMNRAREDGVALCCEKKEHAIATIWAHAHGLILPDLHDLIRPDKVKSWYQYYRWSTQNLKAEIYDRMSGVPGSHSIFYNLTLIREKEALVAISLYLDAMGVDYEQDIEERSINPIPEKKVGKILLGLAQLVFGAQEQAQPPTYDVPLQHQALSPTNRNVPVLFSEIPTAACRAASYGLGHHSGRATSNTILSPTADHEVQCAGSGCSMRQQGIKGLGYEKIYEMPISWLWQQVLPELGFIKNIAYTNWHFSATMEEKLVDKLVSFINVKTVTWVPNDFDVWFKPYSTELYNIKTYASTASNPSLGKKERNIDNKQLDHVRKLFEKCDHKRIDAALAANQAAGVAEHQLVPVEIRENMPEFRVAWTKNLLDPRV